MFPPNVVDCRAELSFGSASGVVSDLRFERANQVCRRVDDGAVEREDGVLPTTKAVWKALQIRIEPDAQQRILFSPPATQLVDEHWRMGS